MKTLLDLRSDTVTMAGDAMRQAMAHAVVGDSLMGEDPTVRELEQELCAYFGFRHATFVPSGTMSNQLLLRCQSEPGDAILAPASNHIFGFEAGACAALAGLQLVPAPVTEVGSHVIEARAIGTYVPSAAEFFRPPLTLVATENTAMDAAGAPYPRGALESLGETCRMLGLKLHVDGARIWHALDPQASEARWLGQSVASLSVCLSKGLGAPVGSVALINDSVSHARLKRFQRMYGGCMRQAGHLAAAGLYAWRHNFSQLAGTHSMAATFAAFCRARFPEAKVHWGGTNIVLLEGSRAPVWKDIFASEHSCALSLLGPERLRAVFHIDIDAAAFADRIGGMVSES